MVWPPDPPFVIRFGSFELNVAEGQLRKAGVLLKLHPQPLRVLLLLTERSGQIVSREEIQHCLWGNNTFVDYDRGINFCVNQIRAALADDAEEPRYVETVPRRGYRFIYPLTQAEPREQVIPIARTGTAVERLVEPRPLAAHPKTIPELHAVPTPSPAVSQDNQRRLMAPVLFCVLGILVAVCVGFLYFSLRHKSKLTEKDTVLISDFQNATDDRVFDDALKQGLAVELGQSPFLNVLSEKKAGEVLRMMGRSPDERLTADLSRELCVRSGSKALVSGTISRLGARYVVDLDAVLCSNGDILAKEQAEAPSKEDILKALSRASAGLRVTLGESLPSLKKYDVPIEATTTSLEALKDYSLAGKVWRQQGEAPSIQLMERAIELDPDFAMAYDGLARRYSNLNEPSLALQYSAKAYELRDRVTERERLLISTMYFRCTGEIEKQQQLFAQWTANYPRSAPHESLGVNYLFLGHYQLALEELEAGLQGDPDNVTNYENLAAVLLALGRLSEANDIFHQAASRNLNSGTLHWISYYAAFLQNDSREMRQQLSEVAGQPGAEDLLLAAQSDTEAFYGRVRGARDLSAQAVNSATRAGLKEVGAQWQALAALREAEFGDSTEANRGAEKALALAPGRNVKLFAALTLARTGEIKRAQELANELEQENSSNTVLKLHRLPTLHAAIALRQNKAEEALTILETAKPYELGQPSPIPLATLYLPFLRGQAFLLKRDGTAAAVEFQKILDNPGIALNFPVSLLAHVELARAYAIQGELQKARASYQDFLTLSKDADPDIPILKQAKAEYAKLQ